MSGKPNPLMAVSEIIRSKRKTLCITVTRDARLVVRAPMNLPESRVADFINLKRNWIIKKMEYARRNKPLPRNYSEGDTVLFLGKRHQISYRKGLSRKIELREKLLVDENSREGIKELLKDWYVFEGYRFIPQRVGRICEDLPFKPSAIKVTKAEKRWGSCSSKGSLCFSWRLMMLPLAVIDYVIVHELVHLEIRDHSQRFWKRVEALVPDYRERRSWLRENEINLTV